MEAQTIDEVIRKVFGGDSGVRGRLFITCVRGEHMLVVTDPRETPDTDFPMQTNVYVPTVCKSCAGNNGGVSGIGSRFELSDRIIRRSGGYEAISRWCGDAVEIVRQVNNPDTITCECKSYRVLYQSAVVVYGEDGGVRLDVRPHFDTTFL